MASIQKHKKRWRAQVSRAGVRKSKVFATRQEARDWAARIEAEAAAGARAASRQPFSEVLTRYLRDVSSTKRGERWEAIRIRRLLADPIAAKRMCDLDQTDFAAWRDARLRDVSPGTVRREMNLLSAILTQARAEWLLIPRSPMTGVRQPPEPPRRDRLPTAAEIARLEHVGGTDLAVTRARAVAAFLFAMETGMRAGEIVGLTAAQIDRTARVAHLPRTKNGDRRDVPLSRRALDILEALPEADPVFGMSARVLDASFRAVRDRAGIEGLTFHDSRHAAVTRLSRRLDPLALARMIGHRDLKMLLRYYDESASELALRLDEPDTPPAT